MNRAMLSGMDAGEHAHRHPAEEHGTHEQSPVLRAMLSGMDAVRILFSRAPSRPLAGQSASGATRRQAGGRLIRVERFY